VAEKQRARIDTRELVTIFIRVFSFFQVIDWISSIGMTLLILGVQPSTHPDDSNVYYRLAWTGGLLGLNLLVLLRADAIAGFLCPSRIEIEVEGSSQTWIVGILQCLGIFFIVSGLASSGSVVVDSFRADGLNGLYKLDLHFWSNAFKVAVDLGAGLLLAFAPRRLSGMVG